MTNLTIRTDIPGKDNSWWIEPAYADNLAAGALTGFSRCPAESMSSENA